MGLQCVRIIVVGLQCITIIVVRVTMYQDYSCGGGLQCIRIIVVGGYSVSGL